MKHLLCAPQAFLSGSTALFYPWNCISNNCHLCWSNDPGNVFNCPTSNWNSNDGKKLCKHPFSFLYNNSCVILQNFYLSKTDMITWESYKHVDYTTTTRTAVASSQPHTRIQLFSAPKLLQTKKQFVETTSSRSEFNSQFHKLAPKAFKHHQLERVQREVHNAMYDSLSYGSLLIQMDYAENIKLVVREQR
jgi:hypothetical protein